MKKKYIITLLLTLIVSLVLGAFCVSCGGSVFISEQELAMNLYDEVQLTATGDGVQWNSSNESIVTVTEDGLVIAQGVKGDATITAKSGNATAKCQVRVRDWDVYPVVNTEETRAFIGALTDPIVYALYADKNYAPDSVSFTSKNEEIATVENGKVKGVAVGETELDVSMVWKKREMTGTVKIVVYPAQSLILKETTASIYAVPDETVAKRNTYEVQAEIFNLGKLVENPTFTLEALTNVDYVTVDGTSVKVAKMPEKDGVDVQIAVRNDETGVALEEILTLKVCPNYIVMDGMKELTDTKSAKISLKLHEEEVDGRANVVDYTITDVPQNKHETAANWANWNTRIEFASTQTLNGHSAYTQIKSAGYRMISADIYYKGENGMFFGSNGSSSYYYTNVRNNRTDIILVDKYGRITNTLIANEWMTVFYDLDQIIIDTTVAGKNDCNIFLSCNYINDTCYIDNVRYWFDMEELAKFDLAIDVESRELTQDSENSAKAYAPANEFIEYAPLYVSFESANLDGTPCFEYDSSHALTYDIERRSKINAYNDLNGMAVKKGYQYITFDILVESGTPYCKFYELYSQKELMVKFTDGASAPVGGVRFFKNGAEVKTFAVGGWYTVAIRIDGKAKEAFYLTSTTPSVFYLKDVRYYKDDSFAYEYGEKTALTAYADNVASAYYVGDEIAVADLLAARFKGEAVAFEVESVTVADDAVATVENGSITVVGVGKTQVQALVSFGEYQASVTFSLRVLNDSRVEIVKTESELYCGEKDFMQNSFTVLARAYENRELVASNRLQIVAVSGGEFVAIDGMKVTGKAAGVAVLKVGYEKADGAFFGEEFTVEVFDTYRARTNDEFVWGNRDNLNITYGKEEGEVGGRTGVYAYYSPTSGSWNDRLMVYESGHAISGAGEGVTIPYGSAKAAFENLTAKNIAYVTFDIYLTEGAYLRVQAPESSGEKDQRNDYYAGSAVTRKQDNENIRLYGNGSLVTGTVQKDTWYTVVIDHKTASGATTWTAMFLTGCGKTYIDNVRYYHDGSWMLDFAQNEDKSSMSLALEDSYLVGESVEIVPTVTYLLDKVQNYEMTVTVKDSDLAEYDGSLQVLKAGQTEITVSVTVNGETHTKSYPVTFSDPNRIETLQDGYSLWLMDNAGESFPNQTDIAANVFVDGAQMVSEFTLVDGGGIVELVNGKTLKAVKEGSATVKIAYKNNEKITAEIAVTVYGKFVQKDGGELLLARQEKSTYAKVGDGTQIGGRTGVYAFTNKSSACWNDRLAVYESSHAVGGDSSARAPFANSVVAHANMRAKQYNYVTVDVYLTEKSGIKVSTINSSAASSSNYYEVGKKLSDVLRMENDCVSLYDGEKKLALTDAVEAGKWYTVVIDYAATKAPAGSSVWAAIEFAGCFGTSYFDNVRYWFVNPITA